MDTEKYVTPRLYVADLAAYNAGKLHGAWIELTPETDIDEVREAVQAMLAESPLLPDEVAEEYAIHDYEGFHGLSIGEHENLETVLEIASLITRHRELGAQLLSNGYDVEEAETVLEEQYAGCADSLSDWADEYLQDTGELEKIPEHWRRYLDLDRYVSDLELGGDIFTINTSDGEVHVFWTQ